MLGDAKGDRIRSSQVPGLACNKAKIRGEKKQAGKSEDKKLPEAIPKSFRVARKESKERGDSLRCSDLFCSPKFE